jgi:SAM-dependent methyltransferase
LSTKLKKEDSVNGATNPAHRRAERALERQLEYQQHKAGKIRGHETEVMASMREASQRVREVLQQVRPISPEARVLEVGSGAHGLIFFFDGGQRIGVDPLADSYSGLFPAWQRKATTIAALGEFLPFADNSFDIVLCDNVVDHAESPARIVSEMLRVLAPDGLLYFTVNFHHPIYAVAASAHAAWQRLGIKFEVGPFADHTVHLTHRQAQELFLHRPVEILREIGNVTVAKARARQRPPRHLGDRLKRVFFKNALYEVVAIRK